MVDVSDQGEVLYGIVRKNRPAILEVELYIYNAMMGSNTPFLMINGQSTPILLNNVIFGGDEYQNISSRDWRYTVLASVQPLPNTVNDNPANPVYFFDRQSTVIEAVRLPDTVDKKFITQVIPQTVSEDGRYVIYTLRFDSHYRPSKDLFNERGNLITFVWDRQQNQTFNIAYWLYPGFRGFIQKPQFSMDNKRLAFLDYDATLTPSSTIGLLHSYVLDIHSGQRMLISANNRGIAQGQGRVTGGTVTGVSEQAFSANGEWLAFKSGADPLTLVDLSEKPVEAGYFSLGEGHIYHSRIPDIDISVKPPVLVPAQPFIGDNLTLTITAQNDGLQLIHRAWLRTTLATGLSVQTMPEQCHVVVGLRIDCLIGDLLPGEAMSFNLILTAYRLGHTELSVQTFAHGLDSKTPEDTYQILSLNIEDVPRQAFLQESPIIVSASSRRTLSARTSSLTVPPSTQNNSGGGMLNNWALLFLLMWVCGKGYCMRKITH